MIYLETHVNKDGTHFNNETKEICVSFMSFHKHCFEFH